MILVNRIFFIHCSLCNSLCYNWWLIQLNTKIVLQHYEISCFIGFKRNFGKMAVVDNSIWKAYSYSYIIVCLMLFVLAIVFNHTEKRFTHYTHHEIFWNSDSICQLTRAIMGLGEVTEKTSEFAMLNSLDTTFSIQWRIISPCCLCIVEQCLM